MPETITVLKLTLTGGHESYISPWCHSDGSLYTAQELKEAYHPWRMAGFQAEEHVEVPISELDNLICPLCQEPSCLVLVTSQNG